MKAFEEVVGKEHLNLASALINIHSNFMGYFGYHALGCGQAESSESSIEVLLLSVNPTAERDWDAWMGESIHRGCCLPPERSKCCRRP